MKKSMRVMMCLLLVILMVAVMAVPAMAAEGTGNRGGYDYEYYVTRGQTTGTASINITGGVFTYVSAEVVNTLYYDLTNQYGISSDISESYKTATATADNIFYINGVPVRAIIKTTTGNFRVNGLAAVSVTEG